MERKIADTEHDLLSLIEKRWSPRAFDPKRAVSQEDLEAALEAASWAPSSMNEQPWRYYYAHASDKEGFQKLFDCLVSFNQKWVENAAVLIAITHKTQFSKNGKPNEVSQHDVGLANGFLVLEALSRGIHAHMMGGYSKEDTRKALDLPEDEEPVCYMALGYIGELSVLPNEDLKEQEKGERERKDVSEISRKV